MLHIKFGFDWPSGFREKDLLKSVDNERTDDGSWLTLSASRLRWASKKSTANSTKFSNLRLVTYINICMWYLPISQGSPYFSANLLRPTIKNCWFAVLLPTRQNWPYPKNFMAILWEIYFFFFFSQKTKNKDSFSQNYYFQNLFYVLTMFYYTVLTSVYPILIHIHLLIQQIIKLFSGSKKKWPTYLPTLKLMGRSTANKESFKDGLISNFKISLYI